MEDENSKTKMSINLSHTKSMLERNLPLLGCSYARQAKQQKKALKQLAPLQHRVVFFALF